MKDWFDAFTVQSKLTMLYLLPLLALLAWVLLGAWGRTEALVRHWQLPETAQLLQEGMTLSSLLQQERRQFSALPSVNTPIEVMTMVLRTDMAIRDFDLAQRRWLGGNEAFWPSHTALNQSLAQLPVMRSGHQRGGVSDQQLRGLYTQIQRQLHGFLSRLLASGPEAEGVNRGGALMAAVRASERLAQLPLAPAQARHLQAEFNLHLAQYRSRLNPKSAGLGARVPPTGLAPLTAADAGDSEALTQRQQRLAWHVAIEHQLTRGSLLAAWQRSLTSWVSYLLVAAGLLMALGYGCRSVATQLYRRISGLSLALRAVDQQKNYQVRLMADSPDELGTISTSLNGVLTDADTARRELALAKRHLQAQQRATEVLARCNPKVTPLHDPLSTLSS
ncbi:nitrate- and nitrite sensing domain-containing protein [Ferrimonas kyonanensis]|uniref:nitrate- and nitrite sensing domain-containing protein n=1 Tax=Ferrimonas kyonanensis TaxID=364763 RepID=UPI0004100A7C|nr:nitrate- and nitrite sensing domain-containing protein [Ferrimonas kyonanensis]